MLRSYVRRKVKKKLIKAILKCQKAVSNMRADKDGKKSINSNNFWT